MSSLPRLDPQGALQKTVYDVLKAAFPLITITDTPNTGLKFPYFRIGESYCVPNDTKDIPGDYVTETIHYFSGGPGNKDAKEKISAVKAAFSTITPPAIAAPFAILNVTPEYSRILEEQDPEGPAKHAVIPLIFNIQQI